MILSPGPLIELDQLTQLVVPPRAADVEIEVGGNATLVTLADEHTRRVLARSARLEDAAEILGIDVATIYRRRRKWQDDAPSQKLTEF